MKSKISAVNSLEPRVWTNSVFPRILVLLESHTNPHNREIAQMFSTGCGKVCGKRGKPKPRLTLSLSDFSCVFNRLFISTTFPTAVPNRFFKKILGLIPIFPVRTFHKCRNPHANPHFFLFHSPSFPRFPHSSVFLEVFHIGTNLSTWLVSLFYTVCKRGKTKV